MLPDSPCPSSSRSHSRHEGMYKGKSARDEHNVRRKAVTVEIRKKKRDSMLLERRTRNVDPSSLNVETELGTDVITRIMNPSEFTEGLSMAVEKMRSSIVPLGMALASSGIMSKIVKSYSKNEHLVLLILRNLDNAGPNFIESADHSVVFASLVTLIRDPKWQNFLDQLLFASCIIYENKEDMRNSQGAIDLVEIVMNLLPNVNMSDVVLVRNTVWMTSLLLQGTSTDAYTLPLLSLISDKLSTHDFDIVKDVCAAFSEACEDPTTEEFVLYEMIPTVVSLISASSPPNILPPIVQSVIALFEYSRDYVDRLIECGLLDSIGIILSNGDTCADAAWLLGVIVDSPSKRKTVADNETLLSHVESILLNGTFDQRKECVTVVRHLVSDSSPHLRPFALSCIPSLCDLLTVMNVDVVQTVCESLLAILGLDFNYGLRDAVTRIEECDGLSKLEFLQNSRTVEVSMLANEIVDLYFDREEEENEDIQSTLTGVIEQVCNCQTFHFS